MLICSRCSQQNPDGARFCPNCGSGVINEPEVWPDHVVIKVGTLDDPTLAAPTQELYARSRASWVSIVGQK